MIVSLLLLFLAVFLTGVSQVLLKIGSAHQSKRKESVLAPYLNIATLFAYGLLFCVTMISVIVLTDFPLKVVYSVTSLVFLVVVGLSWLILKEKMTRNMIIATLLISFGVIIFNV